MDFKKNWSTSNLDKTLEKEKQMELIEGHPVCKDCLDGKHNHPIDNEELRSNNRADCKNTGKINGNRQQCSCGFGGEYKDGKWIDW
jgi:hypothetical protein